MAMKEQQRAVYRSMQGKEVDMNKLINQNEMTVAVGNVKVNARGDELGPGGRIARKREDVMAEYYTNNPNAAPDEVVTRPKVVAETKEVEAEDTIISKLKSKG
jgi:hypothetical protein